MLFVNSKPQYADAGQEILSREIPSCRTGNRSSNAFRYDVFAEMTDEDQRGYGGLEEEKRADIAREYSRPSENLRSTLLISLDC
jgi:hypothetical protein